MSKCANCGSVLTCGCQRRQLPNGKSGCSKCAGTPVTNSKSSKPIDPVINNATVEPK